MAKRKAARPKPKSHLRGQLQLIDATPIAYQQDFFGGPEVPVYIVTSAALALKLMRTETKLSGVACARACGLTREKWAALEDGAVLLMHPMIELPRIRRALEIERQHVLTERA